jgi:NDP-sugar pyrophosphorylase family protein
MAEYKVIITTSGLGSRLGELTNYTNKSLVRVADKPAISYIIESYPSQTEFIITLGHFGSHVKQYLQLAYPNHKFTFVDVDNYKGPGSSLGYSLLQCKHKIDTPFIFHASDTIITNYNPKYPSKNYIIGSHKEDPAQYRTLHIDVNKLIKIKELIMNRQDVVNSQINHFVKKSPIATLILSINAAIFSVADIVTRF